MDIDFTQASENAKVITETMSVLIEPTMKIVDLTNLNGLTKIQKIRIENSLNFIHLSRIELLKATYPNDDFDQYYALSFMNK